MFGPCISTLLQFAFEGIKELSEIVVLYGFKNKLPKLVFPEDALLFPLHESADQLQGLYTVI